MDLKALIEDLNRSAEVRQMRGHVMTAELMRQAAAELQRLSEIEAVLTNPEALHLHCLRTLSREQIQHLAGDEVQRLEAENETLKREKGERERVARLTLASTCYDEGCPLATVATWPASKDEGG